MKYYSVDIQVDFEVPRGMPPQLASDKPWRAVGYFQYFYCTERSKEKAKQLVLDFVRRHETMITINLRGIFVEVTCSKKSEHPVLLFHQRYFRMPGSSIFSMMERTNYIWVRQIG